MQYRYAADKANSEKHTARVTKKGKTKSPFLLRNRIDHVGYGGCCGTGRHEDKGVETFGEAGQR